MAAKIQKKMESIQENISTNHGIQGKKKRKQDKQKKCKFAGLKFYTMYNYNITGIQQVGIGTTNMVESWKWYADCFQMNIRVLEDDTVAELMLPYTGNVPQKRHACIAANLQGGGGFEIWQYSDRTPVPCTFDIQIGDLGIFIAKIKSHNIEAYHEELSKKCNNITPIYTDPRGIPTFYIHDPAGNCFQVVEDAYVFIDEKRYSGGIVGAMIGVTNIEKSMELYRDVLGYDTILYDKNGVFSDWQTLRGGNESYRRVLLGRSKPHTGPFSELYGTGTIELVQALDRTPRKIYEGRFWGDPGFIQICFDIVNMREMEKFCNDKGYKFTVDSCANQSKFDMGEASGHFTYIEDPDGTLIELVETHKIPIISKLGWYINLIKKDRTQPLSRLLFKFMRFNRVKF